MIVSLDGRRRRAAAAMLDDFGVDGVAHDEPPHLDQPGLAIAPDAPDGLRLARLVLVLRRGEQRVDEDGVVGARRRVTPGGVRLVSLTIPGIIKWYYGPNALLGLSLPGYMDHTGCRHQLVV
jgi:hypothetical protein